MVIAVSGNFCQKRSKALTIKGWGMWLLYAHKVLLVFLRTQTDNHPLSFTSFKNSSETNHNRGPVIRTHSWPVRCNSPATKMCWTSPILCLETFTSSQSVSRNMNQCTSSPVILANVQRRYYTKNPRWSPWYTWSRNQKLQFWSWKIKYLARTTNSELGEP